MYQEKEASERYVSELTQKSMKEIDSKENQVNELKLELSRALGELSATRSKDREAQESQKAQM
jgi:hypothetical protein